MTPDPLTAADALADAVDALASSNPAASLDAIRVLLMARDAYRNARVARVLADIRARTTDDGCHATRHASDPEEK